MSRAALSRFVERSRSLLVITGAGCSAPSGIDTYRDDDGTWRRSAPVQHQEFLTSDAARRRYWARSMRGWPAFEAARPNGAHHALAALEGSGRIRALVTQNVDGLHQQAGHRLVIELHGNLSRVVCMDCGGQQRRAGLQAWLETRNGAWLAEAVRLLADGDAEFEADERFEEFEVPGCPCGGLLKPDVVFYGDSVPRQRVEDVRAHLREADGVLVVGSSLMVYSSYRFLREAKSLGLPMAAINTGRTRADDWLECKWRADSAVALPELVGAT